MIASLLFVVATQFLAAGAQQQEIWRVEHKSGTTYIGTIVREDPVVIRLQLVDGSGIKSIRIDEIVTRIRETGYERKERLGDQEPVVVNGVTVTKGEVALVERVAAMEASLTRHADEQQATAAALPAEVIASEKAGPLGGRGPQLLVAIGALVIVGAVVKFTMLG